MRRKTIILYNILILFVLYIMIALFFTIVYIALDFIELGWIVDYNSTMAHQETCLDLFTRSLYFSCTTLFAVGYGDMLPLGLSKGVAILQALVGYILPYVLILNYLVFNPRIIKYHRRKK